MSAEPAARFQVGPAERIWKSDRLISSTLRERLLVAAAPLESVSDPKNGWYACSGGPVLDLVDPFLYPIVYGCTMASGPGSSTGEFLEAPMLGTRGSNYTSRKFQWLPSDFFVDSGGRVTLTSPYINNIHPIRHKELHSVIPEILHQAVPMFERVLSDTIRPLLRMRIITSVMEGQVGEETADCIWGSDVDVNPSSGEQSSEYLETWSSGHCFRTPDAREKYGGDLEVTRDQISLRDRTLQVIVKLEKIVLTPEEPRYTGGKWHVEGFY